MYTLFQPFVCVAQNMVAALYSSREGKTKQFTFEGAYFGWSAIEEMFTRELKRVRAGVPCRVPGLRESCVFRDIWTRLNFKPAKNNAGVNLYYFLYICICTYSCDCDTLLFFWQQLYIMAKLNEYLDSDAVDLSSTELIVQFLEALNKLFEEGFLSHQQINSTSDPIFQNMEQGYTNWLDSLLAEGVYI